MMKGTVIRLFTARFNAISFSVCCCGWCIGGMMFQSVERKIAISAETRAGEHSLSCCISLYENASVSLHGYTYATT